MITKNQIRLIKSLSLKKGRIKHQLFVVEGRKNIAELLNSGYEVHSLFAIHNWINENKDRGANKVSNIELGKISSLRTPNEVLALVRMKHSSCSFDTDSGIVLVLDGVSDPGNMGTIIRMCDWFGVNNIICSPDCVDVYNPKVIQATMGSIFRVNVIYTNLADYLKSIKDPIYGAFMNGDNVRKVLFPENLHLVMGNESNGITKEVSALITNKIKVKNIAEKAESLNVAIAASVLLYEICN